MPEPWAGQMSKQRKDKSHDKMHLQIAAQKTLNTAPGPVAIAETFAGRKNYQKGQPADR